MSEHPRRYRSCLHNAESPQCGICHRTKTAASPWHIPLLQISPCQDTRCTSRLAAGVQLSSAAHARLVVQHAMSAAQLSTLRQAQQAQMARHRYVSFGFSVWLDVNRELYTFLVAPSGSFRRLAAAAAVAADGGGAPAGRFLGSASPSAVTAAAPAAAPAAAAPAAAAPAAAAPAAPLPAATAATLAAFLLFFFSRSACSAATAAQVR